MPKPCAALRASAAWNQALKRKRAIFFENRRKRFAVYKLHSNIDQAVFGLAEIIDGDGVRVIYLACHFGLSLKASYELLITYKFCGEDFNSRQAVYLHMLSLVNSAHASLSKFFHKAVTPRNNPAYHRVVFRRFELYGGVVFRGLCSFD